MFIIARHRFSESHGITRVKNSSRPSLICIVEHSFMIDVSFNGKMS